jgi:hypothetical protein
MLAAAPGRSHREAGFGMEPTDTIINSLSTHLHKQVAGVTARVNCSEQSTPTLATQTRRRTRPLGVPAAHEQGPHQGRVRPSTFQGFVQILSTCQRLTPGRGMSPRHRRRARMCKPCLPGDVNSLAGHGRSPCSWRRNHRSKLRMGSKISILVRLPRVGSRPVVSRHDEENSR